ncbi:major facilitator superfamily transporter [Luteitalea pratensis]|uniref:Major facilitator superfamily transporter n=2 Tax=Luteitalea pratensis TaxID=1855912 RepID=A0A143PTN2_LUTPR|nr:major facilitator superfamily transporter [Luteitalea pratensis]
MFGFSFLVFVSVFQLLPVAPYRMLALGGTPASAGWFLGLLTISCAVSAPFTGPLCDRVGHRRSLIIAGSLLSLITLSYASVHDNRVLLTIVVAHGVVWSALMAASSAYATATIPPARRAEGLGYWGMASILAIGIAPSLGFWVYRFGWGVLCVELSVLNVLMTTVGCLLPDERAAALAAGSAIDTEARTFGIEWRVILLAVSLSLISYGYGGLTSFSALFADAIGVMPRSTFLSSMACSVIAARLLVGRRLDSWGAGTVLMVSLVIPACALSLLASAAGRPGFVVAGVAFGAGFGLVWPSFAALVMGSIPMARRGAAFGAILAAFDTGIGVGSATTGWMVRAHGFRVAYAVAAVLAALALPYFLLARRRLHLGEAVH